jgi:hypothetical protein
VQSRSKEQEVQFYLDRSQEALITVLRSIIGNPRMSSEEQFRILRTLEQHHRQIADLIGQRLTDGERQGYELAGVPIPAHLAR